MTIEYRGVGFAYPDSLPALRDVDLEIADGDVLLVAGPSGSGKSTLLRAANGLVPHSSGGSFAGDVVVFGRSTRANKPRDLADVVGFVHQDPEAQFVVDQVEHDLAFALENLGMDPVRMRRRVEEVLDALGIAHLRDRAPATLSGGERQRCAIAGVLAAAPGAIVLDEPTSQLDPQGAEDVLAAVARLNTDLGTTVVLAEHRLERAAPLSHRAVLMAGGRVAAAGAPGPVLAGYDGAPAVTHLGRLLGWSPPPLTVREARAFAAAAAAATLPSHPPTHLASGRAGGHIWPGAHPDGETAGEALLSGSGITVELGGRVVVRGVDVTVRRGEVVVLMGRNGAGKTSLLRALAGLAPATKGTVSRHGAVAYVPQDPNSLLFAPTVRRELEETLKLLGRADRAPVDHWLAALHLTDVADRHPRSLSAGQRQRVAVAAVAVGGPDVLLLDEPTRGMDAPSRTALEAALHQHAAAGGAAVLATHDVELAARSATRMIVLGGGEVVADGPARQVLEGSLFAPQVLRVLPPFLTVAEVAYALEQQR